MRTINCLILAHILVGCSTAPPAKKIEDKEPTVSIAATLDHIRQSYILGCVEALRAEGKKDIYPACRDKGVRHGEAVRKMLEQPIEVK